MTDTPPQSPDDSPLPASITSAMHRVRRSYEADVPPELVQQTIDHITAQTIHSSRATSLAPHPRSFAPKWFAIGLAAGMAGVIVFTLSPWSDLLRNEDRKTVSNAGEQTASSRHRLSVPDPAKSANTCIGYLVESQVAFSYQVKRDVIELQFTGSQRLSDNMNKWLRDRGIEPPGEGQSMSLEFVRAA